MNFMSWNNRCKKLKKNSKDDKSRGGEDELCKDGENVSFGEIEWQATDIDVSRVFVLGVPGAFLRDADGMLPRCDFLCILHLCQRIHDCRVQIP